MDDKGKRIRKPTTRLTYNEKGQQTETATMPAPGKEYMKRASSVPANLEGSIVGFNLRKSTGGSVKSDKSVVLQRHNVELEASEKLIEKEREMSAAIGDAERAKANLDTITGQIEFYLKKTPTEEIQGKIDELELEQMRVSNDWRMKQIRVQELQDVFDSEKKLIEDQKKAKLDQIMEFDDDNNSQKFSEDEDESEYYEAYGNGAFNIDDNGEEDEQLEATRSFIVAKDRLKELEKKSKKEKLADAEQEESQRLRYDVIPKAKKRLIELEEQDRRQGDKDIKPETGKQEVTLPIFKEESTGSELGLLITTFAKMCDVSKELPEFTGDSSKWGEFYNAYIKTTEKFKYDNDDNLTRLRKALKGEARNSVEGLFVDSENVPRILKRLKEEFGKPSRIISALVRKVEALKSVDIKTPQSVIEFGRAIDHLVSTAQVLKQDEHLRNPYLLNKLLLKLPPPYQSQWMKYVNKKERKSDLETFAIWLQDICKTARDMKELNEEKNFGIAEKERNKNEREPRKPKQRSPGGVYAASENPGKEKENFKCTCCGKENHGVSKCFKFGKMSIDEKWEFVKKAGICFVCLRQGHRIQDCDRQKLCTEAGCKRAHHKLLHRYRSTETPEKKEAKKETVTQEAAKEQSEVVSAAWSRKSGPLHIVKVYVHGPKGKKKIYAMLDSGAARSIVKDEVVQSLGIQGKLEPTSFTGLGGNIQKYERSMNVNFQVQGCFFGAKLKPVCEVVTAPELGIPPQDLDVDEIKRRYPYLRKVQIKSYKQANVAMIIGNDNCHLIDNYKKILGEKETDPRALKTPLGWTIGGKIERCVFGTASSVFVAAEVSPSDDESLHRTVKEFFTLENMGIKEDVNATSSIEDKRATKILEETAVLKDNRWEIGMLWRRDNVEFPPSYDDTLRRLKGIERKMDRDPSFASLYSSKIEEYIKKDFVRKLSREEAEYESRRIRYIPHFGVTNPNKPGKFRLVFDAAARSGGVCLNDELLKGPDLNRPLINVLMNFRRYPVVLMADIADMFHCVKVKKEDLLSQRFLWRGMEREDPPSVYEITVEIFGATCSPTQAIFVKNLNADRFVESHPKAVQAIKNDFYVDDYLGGAETIEDAIQLQKDITMINEKGGFAIRKWTSNKDQVIKAIPVDIRSDGVKEIGKSQQEIAPERVLGINWNPSEDCFSFLCNFHKVKQGILNGDRPTKRQIAGLVMSLYDPLGFVANIKVKGLMLLQSCWNSGIGWDEKVHDDLYLNWKKFLKALPVLSEVRVPRLYSAQFGNAMCLVQLHTFVDASLEAYCAVSYLRISHEHGVDISFVAAKARVAPIRKTTVPKLELQAALMGTRLAQTIKTEIGKWINCEYFWTDSAVVLHWIRSESKRHKMYEANRISEIREKSDVASWKWVPTKLNTADQGTRLERLISTKELQDWTNGPAFLYSTTEEWPKEKPLEVIGAVQETEKEMEFCLPDPARFSSFFRLIRATAAVHLCAKIWITKVLKKKGTKKPNMNKQFEDKNKRKKLIQTISIADMELAQKCQIVKAQHEHFGQDIKLMKEGKPARILKKLSPYIDEDGILRVHGRIDKASNALNGTKRPIILPKRCAFTELLVDEEHKRNGHFGQETILNQIRQQYWIIDGRAEVKRAARRCYECKIRKAVPVIPEMSPLPKARLSDGDPPFTHTGVDLFGPIEVTVKRSREKRWGIIWTCMVTRAVYLDLVNSPSTDQFMMAFTRFVSVMRRPKYLYSDNGTNFKGAEKELGEALQEMQSESKEMLQTKAVEWQFNPPSAPHMGGCWERLVRSVKTVLKILLKETYPADRTLLTLLAEITYTLNCRPITFVSGDANDEEALTPNHILRGGTDIVSYGGSVPGKFKSSDDIFKKQWRRAQLLADHFWSRWRKEYLPTLLLREIWHEKKEPIKVGAVVIVINDNEPRNKWTRGIIMKTFPDSSGNVRTVEVRIGTKNFIRPVTKICPLGVSTSLEFEAEPQTGG